MSRHRDSRPGHYKPIYKFSDSRLVQALSSNLLVALGAHWLFQGLLAMDRTERILRIALEVILALMIALPVSVFTSVHWGVALVVCLLVAHSLNFLCNGQIPVVLKDLGMLAHSRDDLVEYMDGIKRRVEREPSIRWVAAYGSLARHEWKETSDLDIRLVRHLGLWNGVRASWFVMKERGRALLAVFPLDIFVWDSFLPAQRMRDDEPPVVLKGTLGTAGE